MGEGYLLSPLLFNTMLEILARGIKSEKEIKPYKEERTKLNYLSLLDDMIPNSKKPPRSSPENS